MVGPDDVRPFQVILLQDVDGGDVVSDLHFVLLWNAPPPPLLWGLFDQAPGELQ